MKRFFKRIYTKEYLLFLAIGFLPLIYKVFQISFLNSFENAIKILGQMAFLEIIFKIFQETIINPLFKILGKNTKDLHPVKIFPKLVFALFVFQFEISGNVDIDEQ